MKGDFSKWEFNPKKNYTGVLHQQGRALSDQDWNSSDQIARYLRQLQGSDSIGPHVAAIPAEVKDSFKVVAAVINDGTVKITLHPGRVWIDGLVLQVEDTSPYTHAVQYLTSPTPSITTGDRDAVVLEVYEGAFNAFQDPKDLIESALGGVDTTERVKLFHNLKLLRLGDEDECGNLVDKLADDSIPKGKLTVSAEEVTISGDCPIEAGGGYTGFEHYLFRIEITNPDASANARFKWSRFNGGLAGRGTYDSTTEEVNITANDQMINHCGLDSFYLEALHKDPGGSGQWVVKFTADATLSDGKLSLKNIDVTNTWPGDDEGKAFFRLWDGIGLISEFPINPNPDELVSGLGIRLQFDVPAPFNSNYKPGDYWTFPVRAAGAVDFDPSIAWPQEEPPQGIRYHRVPLAILTWNAVSTTPIKSPDNIHDCRKIFFPLKDIRKGCCIDVRPDEDLYTAVNKLKAAGSGCICLLPGRHFLTRPIDLSGHSSIHIKGFGLTSHLKISDNIGTIPFKIDLTNDITFESFVITSSVGIPVWSCGRTTGLTIRNMFVFSSFSKSIHALIANNGHTSSRWSLLNNIFIAPVGMNGTVLHQSTISENYWFGLQNGIDLRHMIDVVIERNQWFGIVGDNFNELGKLIVLLETSNLLANQNVYEKLLQYLMEQTTQTMGSRYTAIDLSSAFDLTIKSNRMGGRAGLSFETVENCIIEANEFHTTVFGASCGLVHGLLFCNNQIGSRPLSQSSLQGSINCQVGLRIIADAVDCRIVDNRFANVQEGIVFESDLTGEKETIRDFSVKAFASGSNNVIALKKLLVDAESETKRSKAKLLLLKSSYFSVGKCERTLIHGNYFRASKLGIEWSGTKNIVDFRISQNTFKDCQQTAIQIEPDDRITFLLETVETKVRLIEKNRFEIFGPMVRSTIGGVRIEKNDVRVLKPAIKFVLPKATIKLFADTLYRSESMKKAVNEGDISGIRLMSKVETRKTETNPNLVKSAAFVKNANEMLNAHPPQKGDIAADNLYVMKTFADIKAPNYLVVAAGIDFFRNNISQEGFIINLSGIQNRVNDNNIYSANPARDGGIIFHLLSGEARSNEVAVNRIGLMMNAKAGQAVQDVSIEGNTLKVFGPPSTGGKSQASYALAIPTLKPGNLSILDNYFQGSVMVGAEPFASLGLQKKDIFIASNITALYNAVKMDSAIFNMALFDKGINSGETIPTEVSESVVAGLVFDFTGFIWNNDPHRLRPVVQFADNRVVQGWVAIAQSTAGTFWTQATLKARSTESIVLNLSGNVFDYWARVVGHDVVLSSNHSQSAIRYRVGHTIKHSANIPDPVPF